MIDRVADRLTDRSLRDERAYVEDPPRVRRLVARSMLFGGLAMVSLAGVTLLEAGLWATACGMFLGGFVGSSIIRTVQRAGAYRNGWLRGRSAMIASLQEASRRGMSLEEWATGELERDLEMMGRW